jgi:hypothetical protein
VRPVMSVESSSRRLSVVAKGHDHEHPPNAWHYTHAARGPMLLVRGWPAPSAREANGPGAGHPRPVRNVPEVGSPATGKALS